MKGPSTQFSSSYNFGNQNLSSQKYNYSNNNYTNSSSMSGAFDYYGRSK